MPAIHPAAAVCAWNGKIILIVTADAYQMNPEKLHAVASPLLALE